MSLSNNIQNTNGNTSNDNEFTQILELLPPSEFKRGFLKTKEDYHYYLLNEIASNSYSQTYSAIKYEKNSSTGQFEINDQKFAIKLYPKNVLLKHFTENDILDMQYSFYSKYKNISDEDKTIQKVYEIIIGYDCILVVTELLENTLKDFLNKNKDICDECIEPCNVECRVEWFFGKLIYDIISKLNELSKKSIYFGSLINSSDIYVRNFNIVYNDPMQVNNPIEDIEFVLTNPFFYEIETIFKILNNAIFAFTYSPEMIKLFSIQRSKPEQIEKLENVYFFRKKPQKNMNEENDTNKKDVKTNQNLLRSGRTIISFSKQQNNTSSFMNKVSNGDILEKLNGNNNSNLIDLEKNNSDEAKQTVNEINFLLSKEEKEKFDAWMIGMLVYDIIFNKFPDQITKSKDLYFIKSFYFPKFFYKISEKVKIQVLKGKKQAKSKVKLSKDDIINRFLNFTLSKTEIQKRIQESTQAENEKKINENIKTKNDIYFTFPKLGISFVMKELLNFCLKIEPKARIYPRFDLPTEETLHRNNKKPDDSYLKEFSIMSESKNYSIKDSAGNLNIEHKHQFLEFSILFKEYYSYISKKEKNKTIDDFHINFFKNVFREDIADEELFLKKKNEIDRIKIN